MVARSLYLHAANDLDSAFHFCLPMQFWHLQAFLSALELRGPPFQHSSVIKERLTHDIKNVDKASGKPCIKMALSIRCPNNTYPLFGKNTRTMSSPHCSSSRYNGGTVYVGSGCLPIGIFLRVMCFML